MIFFVTGLGRSGTSCVAEILHTSGINMGHDSHVDQYNSRGYWEDEKINSINASIQKDSGSDIYWWNYPQFAQSKHIDEIHNDMLTFINYNKIPFGAKDCRFCGTWPIWNDIIDFNTVLFIIVRRRIDSIFKSMMRIPGIGAPGLEGRPKEEQVSQVITRHCTILNQLDVPNKIEIWYEDLFRPEGKERICKAISPFYNRKLDFSTVMPKLKHF